MRETADAGSARRSNRAAAPEMRRAPRIASPSAAARGRRPSDRMRRMMMTGCGVRGAAARRAALARCMQPRGTRMRVPIQVLAGARTAAGRPATNGRALRPGEIAGRARRQ
ncbi:hypothetical protein [Burkholderia thailandensis]|uniref:Uncharacterized protein n=1 Tax=Burkholderia thailandensis TaxID=57975 RepID=A0AAW9CUV6_BURTH|nr:hypothetical protein [Burkholderia thailandensis]AJT48967.1 hypothetical protein DR62_08005 [Burkholderia thailandensis]AOI55837.1 hypothetical protein WI24_29540 [Burkholderia thailandensis]AOJ60742.1 hypothetical protein AQ477_30620 [Burkholderia thailandensis]KXF57732.1 hypothetical protein AQ476_23525 [Burkholderia thailandensis]MCS3394634.1 hypothetical protein [Burkholderia thailandensis]